MVRVVIGDEHELANVRLSRAVRDRAEEVDGGIRRKILQCVAVASEGGDALVPGGGCRGRSGARPIIFELPLDVLRIPTEIQDVALADAQMLEQLPGRVLSAFRLCPSGAFRNSLDHRIEGNVRVLPAEETREKSAKSVVPVHTFMRGEFYRRER